MVMSALDLVSKFFGVGGVQTFEKALAARGIKFPKDALASALAKTLGGLKVPSEELGVRVVSTPQTYGFVGGCSGKRTVLSPQRPLFVFSKGERINKTAETIADESAWMLDLIARQSNPKVIKSAVKEASETVTEIAKAA
jgi:hypothetical protein